MDTSITNSISKKDSLRITPSSTGKLFGSNRLRNSITPRNMKLNDEKIKTTSYNFRIKEEEQIQSNKFDGFAAMKQQRNSIHKSKNEKKFTKEEKQLLSAMRMKTQHEIDEEIALKRSLKIRENIRKSSLTNDETLTIMADSRTSSIKSQGGDANTTSSIKSSAKGDSRTSSLKSRAKGDENRTSSLKSSAKGDENRTSSLKSRAKGDENRTSSLKSSAKGDIEQAH